jgi:hypothetical protein
MASNTEPHKNIGMLRRLILAQLRKSNPGVSDRVLGLLADKLVPKVTTEEEIEGAISDLIDSMPISIKEFSDFVKKDGERRVAEAKVVKPLPGDPAAVEVDDLEPSSDIAKLTKMIEGLTTTVSTLMKEKTTSSIKSQMETHLTEKEIPLFLLKGRVPATEEEMADVLADIEVDWSGQAPKAPTNKLNSFKKPVVGVKVDVEDDTVDPDVLAYTKRKMDAANPQTTK